MASQTPEEIIAHLEAEINALSTSDEDQRQGLILSSLCERVRSTLTAEYREKKLFSHKLETALGALDWAQIEMLIANPGTVTTLHLKVTDTTVPIFVLLEPAPFTTVHLECDFTTPAHFRAVANWIRASPQLEGLHLHGSNLGCEGAQIISKVLAEAPLKILTLNGNQIGDKGGVALAGALAKNTKLTFVNLVDNRMGPIAADAFGWMLCLNTTLKELILSANPLEDQGLADMMAGLHFNTTLRMLGLMGIGATQVQPVTAMLGSNTSLRSLYLNQNRFQSPAIEGLIEALTLNTSVECLDLHGCEGATAETLAQIDTLCERNKAKAPTPDPACLVRPQNAI
jgi:hypothetical protein